MNGSWDIENSIKITRNDRKSIWNLLTENCSRNKEVVGIKRKKWWQLRKSWGRALRNRWSAIRAPKRQTFFAGLIRITVVYNVRVQATLSLPSKFNVCLVFKVWQNAAASVRFIRLQLLAQYLPYDSCCWSHGIWGETSHRIEQDLNFASRNHFLTLSGVCGKLWKELSALSYGNCNSWNRTWIVCICVICFTNFLSKRLLCATSLIYIAASGLHGVACMVEIDLCLRSIWVCAKVRWYCSSLSAFRWNLSLVPFPPKFPPAPLL